MPELVLASLAELAEHGLSSMRMDCLPVPAGSVPREDASVFVPRTERSYWEDIAAALNAAHSVGMPVGIDLDGTLTDRNAWSVVWDRAAEQWAVAGYEDDDAEPDAIARAFVPVQALRERPGEFEATLRHAYATPHDMPAPGSCGACGSAPETWCPDCAACQKGCHDGFVNNPCTHANASWGGA